jgi:hypothetical protein
VRFLCPFQKKLASLGIEGMDDGAISAFEVQNYRQKVKDAILDIDKQLRTISNCLQVICLTRLGLEMEKDCEKRAIPEAQIPIFASAIEDLMLMKVTELDDPDTGTDDCLDSFSNFDLSLFTYPFFSLAVVYDQNDFIALLDAAANIILDVDVRYSL